MMKNPVKAKITPVVRRKNAAVMRRKKVPERRIEAPLMKIRPRIRHSKCTGS